MTSYFPDVNVWLALTLDSHALYPSATAWYNALPESFELLFCRVTQLGYLRLLGHPGVAASARMTQREAWAAYDRWIKLGGGILAEEPLGIDLEFRALANQGQPAPNDFTDSYLAAYANARSVELITFDKVLSRRAQRATLLEAT